MSKRILVPLDGSQTGETALHYVEDLLGGLAAGEKAEITLLQVVKRGTRNVDFRGAQGAVQEASRSLPRHVRVRRGADWQPAHHVAKGQRRGSAQ